MGLAAEEAFKDKIIGHLRAAGTDSISGIARALSEKRDQPVHRLTVAGYLAAMTEMGLLREVPRPPSKHYQLANPNAHRTIYERVGQAVRDVPMPSEERPYAALETLVRVLGRPVFRAELAATRFPVPDGLSRADVDEDRRRGILMRLQKRPWPGLEVPRGDPLLDTQGRSGPVEEVCRKALLAASDSEHLASEPRRQQQLPLPVRDE